MREKTLQLVVTFPTTTAAMDMESKANIHNIPGRLIPLPTEISAGCGLAWKTALKEKDSIMTFLKDTNIRWEMMYELNLY